MKRIKFTLATTNPDYANDDGKSIAIVKALCETDSAITVLERDTDDDGITRVESFERSFETIEALFGFLANVNDSHILHFGFDDEYDAEVTIYNYYVEH